MVHSSHVLSESILPRAPAVNPVADAADGKTVVLPVQDAAPVELIVVAFQENSYRGVPAG